MIGMINMRTKSILYLAAVFIPLYMAAIYVDRLHLSYREAQARSHVAHLAASAAGEMTTSLNQRLALVRGLAAFVTVNAIDADIGSLEKEFPIFAAAYFPQVPGIRNIAVAPDFVVRFVYPLDPGNVKVIGNNILQDKRPGFADAVRRSIETHSVAVHEPVELIQGGLGLLARQAVFVNDLPWGAVGIVFNINEMLASNRFGKMDGLLWALRTGTGKLIGGDAKVFDMAPEIAQIALPEGHWELALAPNGAWENSAGVEVTFLRVIMLALAIAIMAMIWAQTQRHQTLERLVEVRTQALRDSAAFVREIDKTKQRLTEAQNIARLGFIEFDTSAGLWKLGNGAQELLSLEDASPTTDFSDFFSQVEPVDLARLRDNFHKNADKDISDELRLSDKIILASRSKNKDLSDQNAQIITLQDITLRKAEENDRTRMIERLSEASRLESLGTLAGGVAHEINTPTQYIGDNLSFIKEGLPHLLTLAQRARLALDTGDWKAVASAAEIMDYDFLAAELPAATEQSIDGIRRISKIVAAIKEFSYPSGKSPKAFDLNHVIELAVTVTSNQWKQLAEMQMDLGSDLPPVKAIEGEINQVVINLLVNAIQAIGESDRRPGQIQIATRRIDDEIELSVTDSGVGIPAPILDRIFEMFFTTKPPGKGTGQGLAITQAIVRRHGGSIRVKSEPGAGSCFQLRLPISGAAARDEFSPPA
jgi:signal transduction histidine kinase/sensor domain CHASE-containing protein